MDEEFNNLSTDNTATSFSNSPDNTATSDELDAPAVYDTKKRTSYAISKAVAVGSVALTMVAIGATLLSSLTKAKPFVNVDNIAYVASTKTLDYHFSTLDASGYNVFFTVTLADLDSPIFDLNITETKTYSGSIDIPQEGKGLWHIYYAENLEGQRTELRKGTFEAKF